MCKYMCNNLLFDALPCSVGGNSGAAASNPQAWTCSWGGQLSSSDWPWPRVTYTSENTRNTARALRRSLSDPASFGCTCALRLAGYLQSDPVSAFKHSCSVRRAMPPASEHCWDHGAARRVHPCGAPARCVRRCSSALPAELLQRCRNGGRGGVSADNERLQCAVTPGPADDTARGQISRWSSTIHRWTSACTVRMTYAGFVSIRFDPAPADQ
jgi:hypothetical protein